MYAKRDFTSIWGNGESFRQIDCLIDSIHSVLPSHSLSIIPRSITLILSQSPLFPLSFSFPTPLKETIPPPYSVETWKRARRNPQSPALCDRFLAKQILCHSVLRSHAVYCVRSCCFRSLSLFCSLLRFHGSGCLYHLRQ